MTSYDTHFDPAAPVLDVVIRDGDKPDTTSVPMQLDSGAEMSCIPKAALSPLKNWHYSWIDVIDYDGERRRRKTIYATVQVATSSFENIEIIPVNGEVGLLGRDILNQLEVTLDGPSLTFYVNSH